MNGSRRPSPTLQGVAPEAWACTCHTVMGVVDTQNTPERISVPPGAVINIEHERGGGEEEIEFQLTWTLDR